MNSNKQPFFKGLPGFTRATDEIEAVDARESIYYWWWRFMRLSPVFWFARQTGHQPTHPAIAETFNRVGDLSAPFYTWWRETGRYVFAEAKRPAKVTQLELDTLQEHRFNTNALLLEIPLSIRKETIIKQVKRLLEEAHDGRSLNLAATSTATLRLHTKRYRLKTLETEYWVLLYKTLYPDIAIWQVGDRLRIAPQQRVRGVERGANERAFANMNSLTGRYLYKARFTLANVELGIFPNASDPKLDAALPFGPDLHKEYLSATALNADNHSLWQQWLFDELWPELKTRIITKNNLRDAVSLPDSVTAKRFPDFVSGKTDLTQ